MAPITSRLPTRCADSSHKLLRESHPRIAQAQRCRRKGFKLTWRQSSSRWSSCAAFKIQTTALFAVVEFGHSAQTKNCARSHGWSKINVKTRSEIQEPNHTRKCPPRLSASPERQRSQYSLYDDIRCTGDGEPPQCDLPMEVVCNIFDFANFTCAMCEKPSLCLDDQRRRREHVPPAAAPASSACLHASSSACL